MTKTIKSMLRVDAPNSPKLEEMLDAAIAENADEIILDMEETESTVPQRTLLPSILRSALARTSSPSADAMERLASL